ncbi:LuxR C-terminal-related transcriptional regulator [Oceanobacillus polygoni]|uniref:DNA-binding NarL/FixJ family response regulator n=1 Tax=Oceanobacillus polygoni TaxID=1235259 RepID=A0A9X0YPY0_9BACI|nr:LuxR C-terminal-related transcriptional regulator [Oceanobacillus polygoni]MBP2075906.1 DNA-binding NarL/FixJ family response regulator [Oceanobacillus polygoni]
MKIITIVAPSQLEASLSFIDAGSDSIIEKQNEIAGSVLQIMLSIQDAHYYIPSSMTAILLKRLAELKNDNFDLFRKRLLENDIPISTKESLVAYFLKKDLRNSEIAQRIQLREGTVKVHISQIYKKINIKGRENMVQYLNEIMSNHVRMEEASQ